MLDSPEPQTADAQPEGIPDYALFGVEAEGQSPPLPAAEPAPDAGAAQEGQPRAEDSADTGAAGGTGTTTGAEPAQEAGAPGSDPELSAEENALVKSAPEADRLELTGKLKAAKESFWTNYLDQNKPVAQVIERLEHKSPSRFGEFETAIVGRVAEDPARLAQVFKANPEAYGKFAIAAFRNDPDFFLRLGTGREDITFESLKAGAAGAQGATPDASVLTEDDWADLDLLTPTVAEKLKAATTAAPKPDAATEATAQEPPTKADAPLAPEVVIERYQEIVRREAETFEAGIAPVANYVETKMDSSFGAAPTEKEYELTPEVASLKEIKRELFLKGLGKALPSFREGLGKWGEHRKIGKNGERDFDAALSRVGHYATKSEREAAAQAASELIPFADLYFNERLQHPVFRHLDRLIELAAAQVNRMPARETTIPGSGSQPVSSTAATLDDWLVEAALKG